MKKAVIDSSSNAFIAAFREDVDTDLFFVFVDDNLAETLTDRHFYINEKWVYIPLEEKRFIDRQWGAVKSQRNQLLSASDWTQLPDVPLATKDAWATYRQALRDITNQPDPFTIQWPAQPE